MSNFSNVKYYNHTVTIITIALLDYIFIPLLFFG